MRPRPIQGAHGKAKEPRGQPRLQHYERGDDRPPLPPTARQREILWLASHGWGDKHIAAALGVTIYTVNAHWRIVFERLGIRPWDCTTGGARTRAVAVAIRRGYID